MEEHGATSAVRNPAAARLLLWSLRRGVRPLHRLMCLVTGSDFAATGFGERLRLGHPYGIVVHSRAVIGDDCTIMQHVTIGADFDGADAPRIGSGVRIGAGACIIGAVTVGDNAVIGANAVVVRDVPAGAVVGGVPAREIGRVARAAAGVDEPA